ncbi:MAG TPA: DivIVA domain-containing protein [Gemmatimonadales bacterium]|nr:DivIVA domain-containing protein [Gemmatimonadales bacterium]
MSNDVFQLTPQEVRAHDFARAFRGYDPRHVDEFKLRLAEEIDRLNRERVQAEERLKSAQDQLRAYRERERALNEALIAAQQLRVDSREQAEREAQAIIREATAEAARIVDRAKLDEHLVRERTAAAIGQFNAYVASFRLLLERQLGEVDALQAAARAQGGAPRLDNGAHAATLAEMEAAGERTE